MSSEEAVVMVMLREAFFGSYTGGTAFIYTPTFTVRVGMEKKFPP